MNTIIPCNHCQSARVSVSMYPHTPSTMFLTGSVMIYQDLNKSYIKECCLIPYLIGSCNQYLDYDQRQVVCSSYMSAAFKTMIIDSKQYKVFELKLHKCTNVRLIINNRRVTVSMRRHIACNPSNESFQIFTQSELQKFMASKAKALTLADAMKDTDMSTTDLNTYVYLLRDRTATQLGAQVYKVGKTTQPNFERFKGYPKGYKVYLLIACSNCHTLETTILNKFKTKYIPRTDYDTESFEGDLSSMIRDITQIVNDCHGA